MSGPPPPVALVRTAVRRALRDLPAGSLVLVACSGGPDSLALAGATAFVAPASACALAGSPSTTDSRKAQRNAPTLWQRSSVTSASTPWNGSR